MKSLITASLLLMGLIVTCTARNFQVDITEFNIIEVPGSSSSSEESLESIDYVREIETACYEKTGSNQAFEAMAVSFAGVPVCFLMDIDVDTFANDLNRLNVSTRHEFFPRYCPLIRNALPCLDSPIKLLSKCLDDDDALILLEMLNAASEALDLICENDGGILFLEGTTYDVCMQNYSNYTVECANLVSDAKTITGISKHGETQCEDLSKVRDCMQRKFNECNGPRLMDVFDVFWQAVLTNSPCRNFIIGPNVVEDDRARYEIV